MGGGGLSYRRDPESRGTSVSQLEWGEERLSAAVGPGNSADPPAPLGGKAPSPKHPVTPIQTSGVQRRVGGGPLVGGCPLVWEVVLLAGKPPLQEQAMTPIQTLGVHETEGGGPLVEGSVLGAGKPPP